MKKEFVFKMFCRKENIEKIILVLYKKMLMKFIPQGIKTKYETKSRFRKFNIKNAEKLIETEIQNEDAEIYMYKDRDVFFVSQCKNNIVLFSFTLRKELVDEEWIQLFESVFEEIGIVGFEHSFNDYLEQDETFVENLTYGGGTIEDKMIYGEQIDVEYNPGHSHYEEGVWFGSCYRMWFGKDYYQYISKEKLQSFSNCYENCELENGVTRITLYEDMWDYANPVNRKKQWDFRKTVGMDEVAHELKEHPRRKVDPEVEIFEGKYEHGGVRLIHQYYDESGNRIAKSKASKIRILEFSWDGKLLYEEKKLL